jgi:hypothetical protein
MHDVLLGSKLYKQAGPVRETFTLYMQPENALNVQRF